MQLKKKSVLFNLRSSIKNQTTALTRTYANQEKWLVAEKSEDNKKKI